MYTEQELRDAIRCAVCISLKLYPSKEELEEDIASLTNDRVRNIVMAAVVATTECRKIIDLVKSI